MFHSSQSIRMVVKKEKNGKQDLQKYFMFRQSLICNTSYDINPSIVGYRTMTNYFEKGDICKK